MNTYDLGHGYDDHPQKIVVRGPEPHMVVDSWCVELLGLRRVVGGFPSLEAARAWATEFWGMRRVFIYPIEHVADANAQLVILLRAQQGLGSDELMDEA